MKSRGTFIVLGLLRGGLGIHNFYAGYYTRGLAQLLLTLLTAWLVIPIFIIAIWVVLELFLIKKDSNGNYLV
jgi:TM2 domain-containing membrane protein YozV